MPSYDWIFNELGPQTTQQWTWSCGDGKTYGAVDGNGKGKSVNHQSITQSPWHSWPLRSKRTSIRVGSQLFSNIWLQFTTIPLPFISISQSKALRKQLEKQALSWSRNIASYRMWVWMTFFLPFLTTFFWNVGAVADRCSDWWTAKWTARIQDRGQLVLECKLQDVRVEVQRLTIYIVTHRFKFALRCFLSVLLSLLVSKDATRSIVQALYSPWLKPATCRLR